MTKEVSTNNILARNSKTTPREAAYSYGAKPAPQDAPADPVVCWLVGWANPGEAPMRQFTIAAAIVAIAAVFSAASASAEAIFGGPLQQNGKCWFSAKHSSPSDATWGYWGSCAEKASRAGRRGAGTVPAQATTTGRQF